MSHARLGPSNHRWVKCPGSVRVEADYPDVSGAAAIDGTGSHLLLELCLDNAVRAEAYDGQIIGANHPDNPMGWLVSIDRIERVQMALDYIARRHQELSERYPGSTITVVSESKSNPGSIVGRDDWWGTVDITISVTDEDGVVQFIEIADYKDGRGYVSEKDNSQLYSYLIGKLAPFCVTQGNPAIITDIVCVEEVRMTIIQPKTTPVIRYYEPSIAEIVNTARDLTVAAWYTDDENAPLVAGKHCQWCKHKKNCTAEVEQSLERMTTMTNIVNTSGGTSLFETIESTFGDITSLSDTELADLADTKASIDAVYARVNEEIENRLNQGINVPGYKIAPGRSSQVWAVDEDEVIKSLKGARLKKDDIFPPKLISPAQMQKHPSLTEAQRKRLTDKLVTVKAGKMTLKKTSREEKPSVELMFGETLDKKVESVPQCNTTDNEVVSFL